MEVDEGRLNAAIALIREKRGENIIIGENTRIGQAHLIAHPCNGVAYQLVNIAVTQERRPGLRAEKVLARKRNYASVTELRRRREDALRCRHERNNIRVQANR